MKHRMTFTALAAATALAVGMPADLAGQTQLGIEMGAEPEPLTLETVHGESVDLADSFGQRPVLLEFWAIWCPKCETLHPRIIAAYGEFEDRVDFYSIAVAVGQNPRRVRSHLEYHPIPFPMLWDGDGEATRRFKAPTTSYIVILDASGRVAYTGVDVDQDIAGALRRIVETAEDAGEPSR